MKRTLMAALLLLAGCSKPAPTIESNKVPFTFAGIALGSSKTDIKQKGYELFACKEHGQDNAECLVQKGDEVFGFFGLPATSMSYSFQKPYELVTGISIYIPGKETIDKATVEDTWQLKGRCLTGEEITTIVHNGDNLDPGVVNTLRQFNALPSGADSSFACLDKENRFIRVSQPLRDEKEPTTSVDIFYLRQDLADLYGYLLDAAAKHQQTGAEISKVFESSSAN